MILYTEEQLDIYIPKWVFESIDEEILIDVKDTIN
jgi:hypothetical protein